MTDEYVYDELETAEIASEDVFDFEVSEESAIEETQEILQDQQVEVGTEIDLYSDPVIDTVESSYTESEISVSEYVQTFGNDMVNFDDNGTVSDDISYSGESTSNPVIVPVVDSEISASLQDIENTVDSINSHVENIEKYLKDLSETSVILSNVTSYTQKDVKQIGENDILYHKISSGILIALFGSILVYFIFSKLR